MYDILFSVLNEAIAKGKISSYKVPKPSDLEKQKKKPKKPTSKGGLKGKTPADRVPAQLKHCVLALKNQKRKPGQKRHSVRAAWNICRWSLGRYGYLKPPYKVNQRLRNVKQTQKGARASMKHSMEKEAPEKAKRFQDLFRDIEKKVV